MAAALAILQCQNHLVPPLRMHTTPLPIRTGREHLEILSHIRVLHSTFPEKLISVALSYTAVSYTHLTLPTIYSV